MIPDCEKIVTAYLRPLLVPLDARPVSKTPDSTTRPWVRITQLDAPSTPGSHAERLIAFLLQLDCYAGYEPPDDIGHGHPEAVSLAGTVRQALVDMPGVHDGIVVTSARIVGMLRAPDTDFEVARERFILTTILHAHNA